MGGGGVPVPVHVQVAYRCACLACSVLGRQSHIPCCAPPVGC
jgi:hypothetical protein